MKGVDMYWGRIGLLVALLAATAGNVCASSTLTLTCNETGLSLPGGITDSNGCFKTSFITANVLDSLNWGAPYAVSGLSGLGAATMGNNFPISTTTPVANRTATVDNNQVAIQLAPGYTGGAVGLTRVDDAAEVWDGVAWVLAGAENIAGFQGHFNSNSTKSTTVPAGDALLKDTSGAPLELSFLTHPVSGVWFQIASLAGTNSLFVAKVQAFNGSSLLGTYTLTESGAYGSGGKCTTLLVSPPGGPTPCNDAPYVGFYDPQGHITSIYISVFSPGSLSTPIGFVIDSLQIEPATPGVPEPAMPLMIGGGLAAMALYRRKRRAR
jgi:hypothetical protein